MLYNDPLPDRVRLLVLGGGIHGVGVLHDIATRGWQDIHLVERNTLASGTSSRSTKLIHGGLRYLRHLKDYSLVSEALKERALLSSLIADLVKPIELYLPVLNHGGMPRFVLKTGLGLYDFLAGKHRIKRNRTVSQEELNKNVPHLRFDLVKKVYSFWDAQTDDVKLVERVATSARKLGAKISEGCQAIFIQPNEDGWLVQVKLANGQIKNISALYVVNALGSWANYFLIQNNIKPQYTAINSKGIHLLLHDIGHKVGLFLQSTGDHRIFFVLPWQGYSLVGTTESLFNEHPDQMTVDQEDVDYLLAKFNQYFHLPLGQKDIISCFAGLRWLVSEQHAALNETSRASVIGEKLSGRGALLTIYGGKLTTYRSLSAKIGNRITKHFGEFRETKTNKIEFWARKEDVPPREGSGILTRFQPKGPAYTPKTHESLRVESYATGVF